MIEVEGFSIKSWELRKTFSWRISPSARGEEEKEGGHEKREKDTEEKDFEKQS